MKGATVISEHVAANSLVWKLWDNDLVESPTGFARGVWNAPKLEAAFGPFNPPLPRVDATGEED